MASVCSTVTMGMLGNRFYDCLDITLVFVTDFLIIYATTKTSVHDWWLWRAHICLIRRG